MFFKHTKENCMDSEFNKWCQKLLDTGKGNRLINFKDSKVRTVEILAPDVQTVFDKVENGNVLSFYDVDEYIKSFKDDASLSEEDVDDENPEKITKQQVVYELSDALKKNQILSYKKGITLNKVLTNIKKIANTSILEKGINILYLAFGFLNWKENENADTWYSSPLVLIPINLKKESATSPFELNEYEDEIDTNPTLLYKLKNEFGVILPEFRDENEDETITEYFDRIQGVVEKKGWNVNHNMHIGTFSFLKINMYKDLKENEDKILENTTIKKLLNREIDGEQASQDVNVDEFFKEGKELTLHNVVDADSSQMSAIVKAKSGKSIVLQGPPGTGKSQTITNLISELLYDGKKILFVSEKLAALNVVFNNLKKAGLSDFCLELHSNKTNKKDVINELYRVLTSNKKSISESANVELGELRRAKEKLDKYVDAMHTLQPIINKTPYQILEIISKYNNIPKFEYVIADIENKGDDYLQNALTQLNYFINYSNNFGFDYKNSKWYGYTNQDSAYQTKIGFKEELKQVLKFVQDFSNISNQISKSLNIELDSLNLLKSYIPYLNNVSKLTYFDKAFFETNSLKILADKVKNYNKLCEEQKALKYSILAKFDEDIWEINTKDYYLRYKNDYISSFRWFNKNYRHDKKVLTQYLKDKKHKLKYAEMLELLNSAKKAQELEVETDKDKQYILNILSDKTTDFDLGKLEIELNALNNSMIGEIDLLQNINCNDFKALQQTLIEIIQKFNNSKVGFDCIDKLQTYFDKSVCDFYELKFDYLGEKLNALLYDFDSIDNWIKFYGTLLSLNELGLKEFVDKSISLGIDRATLDKTFELMFYVQWIYNIVDKTSVLHNFSRFTQDEAVKTFREKDKIKFQISKAEIIAKLMKNMPSESNMASGSQVSTLVREAHKKRKQRPVRLLLQDLGHVVQRLKPCFLMSPLSVSTYLNSDTCKFDVVIFDEASQIFPWDAVGAISRGQQVIVVGDSKQMPPTNFFTAGMIDSEEDEDELYDDSLDFESILDLCTATFEQNRLNWHYRSKTEDLIAFSNANFYDNSLVTFPSAYKDNDDMGIDFCYVENGVFDRKYKHNLLEAERVVDLVFEHFKKHPERSLGVVAFSISQQVAIENAIQKRRQKSDDFARFFDENRIEPFFVKNLETVQGDERDTIIFSVAYGKDSSGKFIHNFGPLNRDGGERRLNVAITRAKYNIKLVSSIKSYDIDLSKTSSVGVKLLKDYLNYAEQGLVNGNNDLILNPDENLGLDFEKEIYDFLKDSGFEVDMQVGCSEYRIDVGVRYPNKTDYVLAIECDGETYHLGKTTRDRDRLRQEVLERLGWIFYRIWSIDWFLNKENEKKKLLDVVSKAIENFNQDEDVSKKTKF